MPTLASFYGGPSGLISRNTLNVSTGNWSPASSVQPGHTRNSRTANIFSPHKIFLRCNFPARRVRRVRCSAGHATPCHGSHSSRCHAARVMQHPGLETRTWCHFIHIRVQVAAAARPTLRCMPASKGGNEMFTVTFTILRTGAYRCVAFSHLSIYEDWRYSQYFVDTFGSDAFPPEPDYRYHHPLSPAPAWLFSPHHLAMNHQYCNKLHFPSLLIWAGWRPVPVQCIVP